jgi:hypothetical protein
VRSRLTLVCFGFLGSMTLFLTDVSAQDPASAEKPYYYKERAFAIPFKLNPDRTQPRPIEIRLFASESKGPWEQVSKINVGREKLTYRGDRDGRFAFAVQVVREGDIFDPPTQGLKPMMYVVIDTQSPRAVMRSKLESDGSAGVEWDIVDENLDPRSISLEYRWPEQADWLPFDPKAVYRARDTMSWDLKPGQKIEVRIKAKDLAGNEVKTPGVFTPPQVNDNNKFADAMKEQGSPLTPSRSTLFYVNTEAIKLNFDVQVGPSGLSSVDLYVLTDREDWKPDEQASRKYKPNEDGSKSGTQSLTYNAKADGKYGFFIVAKNRAGVGGRPPKKGDLPRVEVIRDTVPPKLEIKDVRVRSNGDRGAIVDIEWAASDPNMAPQPIDIEYSSIDEKEPENWKLVADQLENNGKYPWMVPPEVYQFKLRITARDRAENVTTVTHDKLVLVDLVPPSVDIKDAVPTGTDGQGGKRKER